VKNNLKLTADIINQFPNYFFAGFWLRLFAFLVDLICIGAITSATIGLFCKVMGFETSTSLITFYGLASLAIYLAYFTLLTKLNSGQTIGKMIFGLKVVSLTEDELSWQTVLIRECACRFILKTFIFSIGYVIAAFTPKKQHVGDFFADTSVIIINTVKAAKSRGKKPRYQSQFQGVK